MKGRNTLKVAACLTVVLFGTELAVLASGATDFPLYHVDDEIGYIPAPSQAGSFLRKNDWHFNSLSMAAVEFAPSNAIDTVLLGDSIVYGGNPYLAKDRLGSQLQDKLRNPVWSISAGSWSFRNQLIYLKLHPEVVKGADRIVFVLNSGDFGRASTWSCEKSHPRSKPVWASFFLFKKYVWDWEKCDENLAPVVVKPGSWQKDLENVLLNPDIRGKIITIFIYPSKEEMQRISDLSGTEVNVFDIITRAAAHQISISAYRVDKDSRWSGDLYRDAIHPNVIGTKILAEIISDPQNASRLLAW